MAITSDAKAFKRQKPNEIWCKLTVYFPAPYITTADYRKYRDVIFEDRGVQVST